MSGTFAESDWMRLHDIIGRDLTPAERYGIEENIMSLACMRERRLSFPPRSAVKRQLEGFKALRDDQVDAALEKSSQPMRIELESALVRMGLQSPIKIRPAAYRAAAWLALEDWQPGTDGKKVSLFRQELAKYILALWKQLECKECKAWEKDGKASPIVQFAFYLIDIADKKGAPTLSVVAKLLNEVVA